jgi:hypothetical protein
MKSKDKKNNYTLQDDIKKFKEVYKNDYEAFVKKEKKKMLIGKMNLKILSMKLIQKSLMQKILLKSLKDRYLL